MRLSHPDPRPPGFRTAVDDLHDEIRALALDAGRVPAARSLRKALPALSAGQALEYVTGLLQDCLPPELVAAATEELVEPVDPILTATAIRSRF